MKRSNGIVLVALAALAACMKTEGETGAANAASQTAGADAGMPESYRQVQANALTMQRNMLIAMVDSMPERLLQDKATPAQRSFADQIIHAAWATNMITASFNGGPATALPDSVAAAKSREALKAYVTAAYNYADNWLKTQPAADRAKSVNLFGLKEMPGWQVWDEIHMHTVWTAGQMVANFRKHGMAPPGFALF